MSHTRAIRPILVLLLIALTCTARAAAQSDPYETYVKTSKDFQRVKQDKAWCYEAFPSWTHMPWTYQWTIGYTPESGKWAVDHGYNGAFIDHGNVGDGKLAWIDQFHLRFYMDHTAAKHYLHLWDGNEVKPHLAQLHSTGVRPVPLNAALAQKLHGLMRESIGAVKSSPYRAAYALDDEISWGHFVHPTMWRVTDDDAAYASWLKEIYGPSAPARPGWVSYNDIWPKLKTWSISSFDASSLMDQWTFNDSYWNNFIGDLVEYSNTLDPHTPCGYVGGQSPNAFGGFDYAKVMRKVQYIEAYNLGSSQAVIRSFNPHNAVPAVTSEFHRSAEDDIWQTWYYLAHGNRGFIGWVEKWFDGKTPKPWHEQVAPDYVEAANKIGPLMSGAEWVHDGVAIYYSHASIQLGWIMDAEAHRNTWINRNGDDKLGASHHIRHAWENMLRDSGIQYNFLSYADVIQNGIPPEYKVLILPACLCLSDAEAGQISAFCHGGGTVIADYLPGLWDQHGKGRAAGGALDHLFGIHHDPAMKASDVFGGKLWCEVNQDENFTWKSYEAFLTNKNTCIKDTTGFNKAVRAMGVAHVNGPGKGKAVLMNLSPQWYNAYRAAGCEPARKRDIFMQHVLSAGVKPWVRLKNAGEREHGYEITYWSKGSRRILFVCSNPELSGSEAGGGNSVGLKSDVIPVTLQFAAPVAGVRDERTGKDLGGGSEFKFDWAMNRAIVVSFEGAPGR